ncbi:MAG: glycosyltransferase family 2 protein [Treponema sp.]|nr:glycosyltransferase family 2 protein [Treponema sp.]
MSDLISVIMPAYKSQNTIERSVMSVLSQDYTDLELIVVVDGLDDSTYEVCSKIEDKRLRLFKKENGGVVGAYRYGIKQAKGKYICFCDSDDTYKDGYLTKAHELITQYKCDFVAFSYDLVNQDGTVQESIRNYSETGFYDKQKIESEIIPHLVFNSFIRQNMYVILALRWNKIYTKELINSFIDSLDDNCRQIEDNFFIINAVLNCNSFYICNEFKCYNYYVMDSSISRGYSGNQILDAYFYTIECIAQRIKNCPLIDKHQVDLLAYDNARIVFHRCARNTDYKTAKNLLKTITANERCRSVKFSELKMLKNYIYHIGLKLHLYYILYIIFKH